jgi:hypothetical protein
LGYRSSKARTIHSKMNRNMLELCKKVLLRVSTNRKLFARELGKSVRQLKGEDLKKLKAWCVEQFAHVHAEIIELTFRPYAV